MPPPDDVFTAADLVFYKLLSITTQMVTTSHDLNEQLILQRVDELEQKFDLLLVETLRTKDLVLCANESLENPD